MFLGWGYLGCLCLITWFFNLSLKVLSLSDENVTTQDLEEQKEPKDVKAEHDRQKDAIQGDKGLELFKSWSIGALSEDEVDHLGQRVDPSETPRDHAHHESNCTRVLRLSRIQTLWETTENVRDVVQICNYSTYRHHVAENVAKVEAVGSDVVQEHLFEVATTLIDEHMLNYVAKVVPIGIQGVLENFSRVSGEDGIQLQVSVRAQWVLTAEVPRQENCVLEDWPAPVGRKWEVEDTKELLTGLIGILDSHLLVLLLLTVAVCHRVYNEVKQFSQNLWDDCANECLPELAILR